MAMMNVSTLALWSAIGMVASSASVWAFAPAIERGPARPGAEVPRGSGVDVGVIAPSFARGGSATATASTFTAGDTLEMEGRLGHATIPAGRAVETYVFVELEARARAAATTPPPVDLAIVIDRSGSMFGRRIQNALAAARGMVDRLRDGDTVSVVAYGDEAVTFVPPTRIDAFSRRDVVLALRNLEVRGHTCISCGLQTALDLLGRSNGAVKRMLLLSDGEANVGVQDLEGFRFLADRARTGDASITSIGVDVDYNERVMFTLAQASNGRHYFVEDPEGLEPVFAQEAARLEQTVASGSELELTLRPGVQLLDVVDRSFTRAGDRVLVPMGAFAQNDAKTLLMRVRMDRAETGTRPVADVRLRFRDLVKNEAAGCEGTLVATVSDDARTWSELDAIVEARIGRAEALAALSQANAQFAAGDFDQAQRTLEDNRARLRARREQSKAKAAKADVARVSRDFEFQIGALDKAEQGFDDARAAAPAAPQGSRQGRASVRANAEQQDAFSQ